jgi:molybdopterin-guanine dinucleotide biosynthesis protein A
MGMTKRAAIILAGGKGKRFQSQPEIWQDKALAKLFDKPLLVHAVESVRKAVGEIVICVNDEARKAMYAQILEKHGVSDVKLS